MMKKYMKFALATIVFVAFLGGAYMLYQKLAAEYQPQQNLVVQRTEGSSGTEVSHEDNAAGTPEATNNTGATENQGASGSGDEIGTSNVSGEEDASGSTDAAGTETGSSGENNQEQQYTPAMDFVMENAAGEEVTLYDFVGKPIVLNFWASWCGPCKAEIPDFQATYEKLGGEVQFLMLNATDGTQETKEGAMEFIKEQGYTLPFYFDTQMQGSYLYSIYSLPTTFFINAEGEIIAYAQGMIDAETLEYGISMIYEAP